MSNTLKFSAIIATLLIIIVTQWRALSGLRRENGMLLQRAIAAEQMHAEGKTTSPLKIAVAAPSAFIRSFVLKGGFRDGVAGLTIASFAAHHAFLKHVMLWEKQQNSG